jgi:hypothetical protein
MLAPEIYRTDPYLSKTEPLRDIVANIPPKSPDYEVFWDARWEWRCVLVRTERPFYTAETCAHCYKARRNQVYVYPPKDYDLTLST